LVEFQIPAQGHRQQPGQGAGFRGVHESLCPGCKCVHACSAFRAALQENSNLDTGFFPTKVVLFQCPQLPKILWSMKPIVAVSTEERTAAITAARIARSSNHRLHQGIWSIST